MSECTDADNPTVHFLEVIAGHIMNISFEDLGGHYKHAVSNKDLQLLPSPFGPKVPVSSDVKLQLVVTEENDGTVTILKHYQFPSKAKFNLVKTIATGTLHRPNFMSKKPIAGKKILQYCPQGMAESSI